MAEQGEIVNRVASSGLVTLDLEDFYHSGERVLFDIKDLLFQGLILKEKDFRSFVKEHDWASYEGKNIALTCSVDAIIPTWAYMLLAVRLAPFAHKVIFGDLLQLENALFEDALGNLDPKQYRDAKVVIKGCSKVSVPTNAYVEITSKLQPYAASIMYGEPCSTVPLYKKPRKV